MLREEAFAEGGHCEWFQFSRGFFCEYDRPTRRIMSLRMNGKEIGDQIQHGNSPVNTRAQVDGAKSQTHRFEKRGQMSRCKPLLTVFWLSSRSICARRSEFLSLPLLPDTILRLVFQVLCGFAPTFYVGSFSKEDFDA